MINHIQVLGHKGTRNYPQQHPVKYLPVFILNLDRWYLSWSAISVLTSHPYYNVIIMFFSNWTSNNNKVRNLSSTSILTTEVNSKKYWNVCFDSLICPLQIITDIKTLFLTPHACKWTIFLPSTNVKNWPFVLSMNMLSMHPPMLKSTQSAMNVQKIIILWYTTRGVFPTLHLMAGGSIGPGSSCLILVGSFLFLAKCSLW